MLKGHILDLEREKFAEALTVIEYLTGGERMYMDLYDRAVAECNDRIAELRQPAYEFVDIKAVDIRLFMLQTEQKLGAVAELELRVLGKKREVDARRARCGSCFRKLFAGSLKCGEHSVEDVDEARSAGVDHACLL